MSVASPRVPTYPSTSEPIFRLTVDQYHTMIETGALGDDDPVELLEGLLIQTMPKNPPHEEVLRAVLRLFPRLLPPDLLLQIQSPITLSDGEPEPDVAIVQDRPYTQGHPTAPDVVLLVEVSHTSLAVDTGIKRRSYARAGVPLYWIVNLIDRRIEIYTDPDSNAASYTKMNVYSAGDSVPFPVGGPDCTLPVTSLLPQLRK